MKTYDWIVVGGGLTGAALGYELQKQGLRVLLLEPDGAIANATRYSYGGLAYWAGTSPLTRQLCEEGIAVHRQLSQELEADTQFREFETLLTIEPEEDPEAVATSYNRFCLPARRLTPSEASEIEPLLNPNAISGALLLPHGHIEPQQTNRAYLQAFGRAGGVLQPEEVTGFAYNGDRAVGVKTAEGTYFAEHIAICAGGLSRALLQKCGIPVKLYFTQTEILETPPVEEFRLQTLVMPAIIDRFELEEGAIQPEFEPLWERESGEPVPPILDAGAIQFRDRHIIFGQVSRAIANPHFTPDAAASEAKIRAAIANIFPSLAPLPATWHRCLVAYAANSLPLVGALAGIEGLHLFSGFTNTLLFAPPLAKHFARWAAGETGTLLEQLQSY